MTGGESELSLPPGMEIQDAAGELSEDGQSPDLLQYDVSYRGRRWRIAVRRTVWEGYPDLDLELTEGVQQSRPRRLAGGCHYRSVTTALEDAVLQIDAMSAADTWGRAAISFGGSNGSVRLTLRDRPFQHAKERSLRDLITGTVTLDYESIHGMIALDMTSGDLLHLRVLLTRLPDERLAGRSPLTFSLMDDTFQMLFRESADGYLTIQVLDRDHSPDGYLLRFLLDVDWDDVPHWREEVDRAMVEFPLEDA